jgi:adenine-specific DNA-methyltransferase
LLKLVQDPYCLTQQEYPSLIKYMGSKSKIMGFLLDGINHVYDGRAICDLFSGSGSLAGAIGQQASVHSNDIQSYSGVLADTYNRSHRDSDTPTAEEVLALAATLVDSRKFKITTDYSTAIKLKEFNEIEDLQKKFIDDSFDYDWHLFAKYYSGTWWSYEQCLWIDALREVAERYKEKSIYPAILSSLMFAMAYASQGTGHYAQYRDAKTESSFRDISIYRKRLISRYFSRKYNEVLAYAPTESMTKRHQSTSLDFKKCLQVFEGGTVYADPPYCFVHYSRFYHALETLVLYDFPTLQVQKGSIVKGRYRESRHQSPFCIKSQVCGAFTDLFAGVGKNNSSLVLSYSNTGMISLDELYQIGKNTLPDKKIEFMTIDHQHMTMGRKEDRQRSVKESLLIAY